MDCQLPGGFPSFTGFGLDSLLSCCQAGGVKNPLKHKKGGWLYEEFLVRVPQINRGGGSRES